MKVARMAYDEGLYKAAARNYLCALEAAKAIALPDEELAPNLLGLAVCYCENGRADEAEELFKRALQMDEVVLGPQHYALADDLNYLADFYMKKGRTDEVELLLERALKILEQTEPQKTFQLARTLKELGHLRCEQGRLKEAEQYLNRSDQLFSTGSLKQTKLYAEVLMSMAALAIKQGRNEDADQLIQSGIETLELVTGGEHPEVAEFFDEAARMLEEQGLCDTKLMKDKSAAIRAHLKAVDH